jgi:hypothetical protein
MFFSSHNGSIRGAAILFRSSFQFTLHDAEIDSEGRFIICNLYGPNTDEPNFFQMMKAKLGRYDNNYFILGGYFNVVIS